MNKFVLSIILTLVILIGGYYLLPSAKNTKPIFVDKAKEVAQTIPGKWQSLDDDKFVRYFQDDFTVSDIYENKVVSNDPYNVYEREEEVYLKIGTHPDQSENLQFKVVKANKEELELIYLDRGGTLRFKRI